MTFADFIEEAREDILEEWERFASTLMPAAGDLTPAQLRNDAGAILDSVARDMRNFQTVEAQAQKSRGLRPDNAPGLSWDSKGHGADRLGSGFTLDQLIAEYRALRASVKKLWRKMINEQQIAVGERELDDLVRFDEALDQSLMIAVMEYNQRLEDGRDLLQGALAHDLRNPLWSISASADVLLSDEGLAPHYVALAARVRNGTRKMDKMIDELLDFTRTRLGRGLPINPETVDLVEICRNAVDELSVAFPDAKCEIREEGDFQGRWDRGRLDQLLGNLVLNAIQHGEAHSAVVIELRGNDESVHLSVSNQGVAIPEEDQRVIFDPLIRAAITDDAPSRGLGLGLYIARQIVLAHGGDITLDSSPARGTTLEVVLPRYVSNQT